MNPIFTIVVVLAALFPPLVSAQELEAGKISVLSDAKSNGWHLRIHAAPGVLAEGVVTVVAGHSAVVGGSAIDVPGIESIERRVPNLTGPLIGAAVGGGLALALLSAMSTYCANCADGNTYIVIVGGGAGIGAFFGGITTNLRKWVQIRPLSNK